MRNALQRQADAAASAAAASLWSLTDSEAVECLRVVHSWEKQVAALKARLVGEAVVRAIPAQQGHRQPVAWLRAELLIDPQPARELILQAAALRRHPALEQALITARVDARQSVAIADALDAIPTALEAIDITDGFGATATTPYGLDRTATTPDGLDRTVASPDVPAVVGAAEQSLIEMASRLPAYQLRRVGERILAYVAPEVAERADEAALRRQERRDQQTRILTLVHRPGGGVRLAGLLDAEAAASLQAALQPLCIPIAHDERTAGQRRADALVDICRLALRGGELPEHGGQPSQVAVTIAFDPLTQALGAGMLDSGEKVSAATARRLACDARVLPLVLGGQSQVLDAGRTRRLASGPLRRALSVRDRGCAFPDCDRPPRWCDAHHLVSWTTGGPTSLDNMVLLCRHHHTLLHDPRHGWQARPGPDRLPEFIPPPWTDPTRRPRRNLYHART